MFFFSLTSLVTASNLAQHYSKQLDTTLQQETRHNMTASNSTQRYSKNLNTALQQATRHSGTEASNSAQHYSKQFDTALQQATQHSITASNSTQRYSNARATLDKQSCVITSMLFEMNSPCMRSCDLNFSCLSTSITSPKVFGCQNNKRIQIQYGRPCLHLVFPNFNFVNLR